MSELALKLIRENIEKHRRGEDARFLDLGNCGMTEVPEEIGECVWVEELVLGNDSFNLENDSWVPRINLNVGPLNNISSLPKTFSKLFKIKVLWLQGQYNSPYNLYDLSPLKGLTSLQTLYCNSTKVSDLEPISLLLNLEAIDLSYTGISDLNPLSKLINIRYLICGGTKVSNVSPLSNLIFLEELYLSDTDVADISSLKNLINLREVSLAGTGISDFSVLSGLENLKTLSISGCKIDDLHFVKGLTGLERIFIFDNPILDYSPIGSLKNLIQVTAWNNSIKALDFLKDLLKLERVFIGFNPIKDLSPLSNLENLSDLDIRSTEVEDLTPIANLFKKNIKVFQCENAPLIIPPLEVAQESPQAVRDYFEELGDDGRKLNEVKVIFLGEASAGKTSLVRRLLNEKFDNKESQTHGIRIRKAPFTMEDGDEVTAHLWDFGGQEVMHATHQFFLSQRSVYVLLLNSRNDDQAEKWLKYAASLGGRSPVLVVLNKIDENPSFEVNRKTLQEKYPQIREFFRLSAKTDAGLNDFREALRREIDRADTRRTPFPKHWLAVKEHFSNMTADYIVSAEYRRVCEEKGVTRPFSQDVLLQFLHDLGVVINFRSLKNFDTQILNPLWLTNGVYRIINSQRVADAGGTLYENDFDAVINDPRYKKGNTSEREFHYPLNKLQYIVRVMQEFELCFQLDPRTWVVPQLLPVQEPEFKTDGALLRFVIHFPDFLPDSIFPRLMVKLHTYIDGDRRWRTGMVLHKPNIFKALARVRWDKEDQKILLDVCGEDRRRFLSFIRETVKEIVGDFTNLNFNELVPIPDSDDTEEYEYLVEAEKAGETEVFVKQLKKRVKIADLLDGVEEPAMRDEVEQIPVKAFVSYSHADLEHLKTLRTALSPLVRLNRLDIWDDRDIDAGDQWEQVIFQQLEEADIVLCLVSADFVESDFCFKKEFGAALEAHRKGEKTIVPIMLRKTDWTGLPLAEIQGTPGVWINSAADKDDAWTKVSESLRPALDKAKQRKKVLLEKRKGL